MASNKEIKALITLAGKVDPSLRNAILKTTGQTNKLKDSLKKTGSIAGGVFKGVLGAQVVAKTASALFNAGKEALQLASDLQEVQNVVDVTFGKSAEQINSWAKSALNSFGLSELEAKRFAGTLGAMFKSSGLAEDKVLELSTSLTELAGDMASFYNLAGEEAFEKIRSGISGETEPLKALGINMSVANLEAFALSKGIKTAFNEMDQGSQAMLRYAYLMEVTKDAQGDFTRNIDSFANQQKLLRENYKQLSSQVMSKVIPLAAKGLQVVNSIISTIDGSSAGDKVATALTWITEKAQPVVGLIQNSLIPLIQKVGPILGDIAYITGTVLAKAIEVVTPIVEKLLGLIGPVIEGIGKITSKIKEKLSGDSKITLDVTAGMDKYAEGGFANKPSIFGDDGLEAAIPIKPGNPRSIGLLAKTASMLGVGAPQGAVAPQINLSMPITVYAPGGDKESIKHAVSQAGEELEEKVIAILERYMMGGVRVSYGN